MKTCCKKSVLLLLSVILMFSVYPAGALPASAQSRYTGTFTFTVKGYGHGVGMSQRGAIAYADPNQSWRWTYDAILLHYYQPGVTLVQDPSQPATISYDGKAYPVIEYLSRAVAQEIGPGSPVEALKAQAVAAYTYAKSNNFVLTASQSAFSLTFNMDPASNVVIAATAVAGKYLSYNNTPILAVYFASAAGQTVSSASVWGGTLSYLGGGVSSPETIAVSNKSYTADEFKTIVDNYNLTCGETKVITLQSNPAEWLQIISADSVGYVNTIRVGNREMRGYAFRQNLLKLGIKSHCFTFVCEGVIVEPETPTLAANPTAATNGNVTVTITYPPNAASKVYKIDTGAWLDYTAPVVITANGTVYAKCSDTQGNTSAIASVVIGNIIKLNVPAGSTALINPANNLITGLGTGLTQFVFESLYVNLDGNGRLEYTPLTGNMGSGKQVRLIDNASNNVLNQYTIVIYGDLNGDGIIDSSDAGKIVDYENYVISWNPAADAAFYKAGDLNGDGKIDSLDASLVVDAENYVITIDQRTGLSSPSP